MNGIQKLRNLTPSNSVRFTSAISKSWALDPFGHSTLIITLNISFLNLCQLFYLFALLPWPILEWRGKLEWKAFNIFPLSRILVSIKNRYSINLRNSPSTLSMLSWTWGWFGVSCEPSSWHLTPMAQCLGFILGSAPDAIFPLMTDLSHSWQTWGGSSDDPRLLEPCTEDQYWVPGLLVLGSSFRH